jgi:hypothetical protein
MGRQEDRCWRCGAHWSDSRPRTDDRPRTTLRVIVGGASTDAAPDPSIATAVADDAQPSTEEPALDADRWLNEGGSLDCAAGDFSAPATTARR